MVIRRSRVQIAGRRARVLLSICVLQLLAAGCADAVIVLGDRDPPRFRFGTPVLVSELSDGFRTDNPSLTADLREIYFTSARGSINTEIWTATRSDAVGAFGPPQRLRDLGSSGMETSPVISPDGLTLWFASDRAGGMGDLDVWVSKRESRVAAWSTPAPIASLNSHLKEIPRPLGLHQSVMPLPSDREMRGFYAIYFAKQSSSGAFDTPEIVRELAKPDESRLDGFLTDDGLTLFFVSGPSLGAADLFVAWRRTTDDAFSEPVPLDDLNTADDERDPWLSPDESQLYFASDRGGRYEIYVASARREAP